MFGAVPDPIIGCGMSRIVGDDEQGIVNRLYREVLIKVAVRIYGFPLTRRGSTTVLILVFTDCTAI